MKRLAISVFVFVGFFFAVTLIGNLPVRGDDRERLGEVGIERNFVAAHLVTHQKDDHMAEPAQRRSSPTLSAGLCVSLGEKSTHSV